MKKFYILTLFFGLPFFVRPITLTSAPFGGPCFSIFGGILMVERSADRPVVYHQCFLLFLRLFSYFLAVYHNCFLRFFFYVFCLSMVVLLLPALEDG